MSPLADRLVTDVSTLNYYVSTLICRANSADSEAERIGFSKVANFSVNGEGAARKIGQRACRATLREPLEDDTSVVSGWTSLRRPPANRHIVVDRHGSCSSGQFVLDFHLRFKSDTAGCCALASMVLSPDRDGLRTHT